MKGVRRPADQAEVLSMCGPDGTAVELMRASYRKQVFPPHTHDFLTIGVILRGAASLWCRHENHVARVGDVVIIPPGEVHTGDIGPDADHVSYFAAHVPAATLLHCNGVRDAIPDFDAVIVHDDELASHLRQLDALMLAHRPGADEALASALVLASDRHAQKRVPGQPVTRTRGEPLVVRRAREFLDTCFENDTATSLKSMASQIGVSPFHLVRTFTHAVGLSPHRYLVQLRIGRARELLANGVTCSTAAAMAGFSDQSHMTQQFRRYVGITPASYRRSLVGDQPAGQRGAKVPLRPLIERQRPTALGR
jgi:AraC-like DNA-binding protein/quercetin dioxygenase-like cupin family protein